MSLAVPHHSGPWHLLQVSDVLDIELATALAELEPVVAWAPRRSFASLWTPAGAEPERRTPGTHLRIRELPLLRAFSRYPVSLLGRLGPSVLDRLLEQTPDPANTPLLCTVPFHATTAEHWPGPVIYWLTDLIAEYAGASRRRVVSLDRRLCRAATLVCPNSMRLREYLIECGGCDPARILVVPNATRASNLLERPPRTRSHDHPAFAGIARPIAGVIGNLAANMDWPLLAATIELTPSFAWVFVGPTTMPIPDPALRAARAAVIAHPRTHFLGAMPYGQLAGFARAFDVAVLPYRRVEPTYSGSSTRFYEHLAACRPILATRGLEDLVRKPPLLQLTDTAQEMASALLALEAQDFDDGLLETRWRASLANTWNVRAASIRDELYRRTRIPMSIAV